MEFTIPIQPLTINQAFQGRRYKTKAYKNFEKQVAILLPKNLKKISGEVVIEYEYGLTPKTYGISDVGNLEKCLTDILVKANLIDDDRKVIELRQRKVRSEHFYVKIKIYPYGKEKNKIS